MQCAPEAFQSAADNAKSVIVQVLRMCKCEIGQEVTAVDLSPLEGGDELDAELSKPCPIADTIGQSDGPIDYYSDNDIPGDTQGHATSVNVQTGMPDATPEVKNAADEAVSKPTGTFSPVSGVSTVSGSAVGVLGNTSASVQGTGAASALQAQHILAYIVAAAWTSSQFL